MNKLQVLQKIRQALNNGWGEWIIKKTDESVAKIADSLFESYFEDEPEEKWPEILEKEFGESLRKEGF